MKNREDAEEVTQDVLMKVYRKLGAFRGDAALSSWIYRITFNTAMSKLRNTRLARQAEQEKERAIAASQAGGERRAPRQTPDWSHMPDEELLRRQLREAVAAAIGELPEIYRAPVVLRDIQGLTTEEASSRLKLKDQTLKSRLHRGRLMLRERLRAFTTGLSLHRPTPAYS
jgi:RNA polymerase sigma-70 factor (ECF subfamily)